MSFSTLRLRIEETHQPPGLPRRLFGDAGLVAVGLLAWFASSLQHLSVLPFASGIASLLLASALLVTGRNARLTRGA